MRMWEFTLFACFEDILLYLITGGLFLFHRICGAQGHVMGAAFDDGHGGNQRQLGIALQVGDIGHAHVAHGGLDLIKACLHVVMERTCVGDVGIHTLLKAQL